MKIVAVIAAFNEADVIGSVVADLIDQGVRVYFLDDGSTDDTIAAVEPYAGRGVIQIERLERPPGDTTYNWERILCRKAQLARELDADWFIHHDADEFRESPWIGVTLAEAIQRVDALGYNAIDFASLDFWPVDDRFTPGGDVRAALPFYSPHAAHDRVQIRCWKKADVDLVSSGGHEAQFADRRVFPLRFLSRHYPIRGQAHGQRKVFAERRNRFRDEERARGWHVQYDTIAAATSFVRDPSTLTRYDPVAVRAELALRHRGVEEIEEALARMRSDLEARVEQVAACEQYIDRQAHEIESRGQHITRLNASEAALHSETGVLRAEADGLRADIDALRRRVDEMTASLDRARAESAERLTYIEEQRKGIAFLSDALDQRAADVESWRASVEDAQRRLTALETSLSWRLTAPLRALLRLFTGRRDG